MDGLDQAYLALGLVPGASPADAVAAHRRLVSATEGAAANGRVLGEALGRILDDTSFLDRGREEIGQSWPAFGERERPDAQAVPLSGAGWPITFGTVGAGLAASHFGDGVRAAGVAGEVEVAAVLDVAITRADAFVFHSVKPSGGDGDVDHVIVCGDLLVCIDAKRWAPGRYESVQGPNGTVVYRDGELFPAGVAASSAFLADLLAADLGWPGRVARIIAVTSSGGRLRPVDLSGYSHPDAVAIAVEQLPALIGQLLESTTRRGFTAAAVTALARRTATPTVRSPLLPPDSRVGPVRVDSVVAAGKAPEPPDIAVGMAGIRRAAVIYLALLSLGTLFAWVTGDRSGLTAKALAAAATGAGVWLFWLFGLVETQADISVRATAELASLRRALFLDGRAQLSPMDRRGAVAPLVGAIGLGTSGAGVGYLLLLRNGGWVDLSHLATVAVVVGAAILATAVWLLMERDAARVTEQLGRWAELWVEAATELASSDIRVASAALAVVVDHPEGVLRGYLCSFESAEQPAALQLADAGEMVRGSAAVVGD